MLMSLCSYMLQKKSTSFNTQNPSEINIPCMTGPSQLVTPKSNTIRQNRTYRPYTYLEHNESNPFQAPFCTILRQLILPCSLP